jgi:hypothetical protein
LIGIVGAIAIVAEILTIRATMGVASAGLYLRDFVEEKVPELNFQKRNREFLKHMDDRVSASWGFAIAYMMLTAGLILAWFTIHLSSSRSPVQTGLVLLAVVVSFLMAIMVWHTSKFGWESAERAWSKVKSDEEDAANREPERA